MTNFCKHTQLRIQPTTNNVNAAFISHLFDSQIDLFVQVACCCLHFKFIFPVCIKTRHLTCSAGKLMGMAVRTTQYMDIALAPIVWKLLVADDIAFEDYAAVDSLAASYLYRIMRETDEEVFAAEWADMHFSVPSLGGGRMVELHPGGAQESLTWHNRDRYYREVELFRLAEMTAVAAAVRRGLCTQVPQGVLKLMRWDSLERRVCGNPEVDVALLRSANDYENYSDSDQQIRWFWEILSEFSLEQRKAFLRFTWGRTRLPLTKAQFSRNMKITKLSRCVSARLSECMQACI